MTIRHSLCRLKTNLVVHFYFCHSSRPTKFHPASKGSRWELNGRCQARSLANIAGCSPAARISRQDTSVRLRSKQRNLPMGMHIMSENPTDGPAIENACQDIDRYISELAQSSLSDARLLTPSQRLRRLGIQRAGASKMPFDEQRIAIGLSTNKL